MQVLRKIEWLFALLGTGMVISLHWVFATHAGGLWRDEVNTVSVANLPSLRELWNHIEFDSFPVVWLLVIRFWSTITSNSDWSFRLLGMAVATASIAALWINARAFKASFPFFALALLGVSPSIIRWGDSMRAYGFGILLILLTFGLVWKVVEKPGARSTGIATVVAVLAVQTLYYNAFLLFALCMGGVAVSIRRRDWRCAVSVLAIGAVAGFSLLPYFAVFQRTQSWGPMFQYPDLWQSGAGVKWFWMKVREALDPCGWFVSWIWVSLFVGALGFGIYCVIAQRKLRERQSQLELVLFSTTAIVVGLVGYFLFLKKLAYPTQPWYYIALMAFLATALEATFSILAGTPVGRMARLAVFACILGTSSVPAFAIVQTRMTNLDIIANQLMQTAEPDDMIIVCPWYFGITFNRYYHGKTPWETIPPIEDHRFARVDLFIKQMVNPDQTQPVQPVLQKVAEALSGGHRIWLVGAFQLPDEGKAPPVLPPAPESTWGWHDVPYSIAWTMQTSAYIQAHTSRAEQIPAPANETGLFFETVPLIAVHGWIE